MSWADSPVEFEYAHIVRRAVELGELKENRTGTPAYSVFNHNYYLPVSQDRFPLLTSKEVSWKNIVVENLWFLSGARNTDFLHKHGARFWDHWAAANGTVPSAYGAFWRNSGGVDQLERVENELLTNPTSRRMCVTAWEPSNAWSSKLPPCHAFFVFNVHGGQLNLHLTQRSCDIALGLPYNIAGYALLLSLFSRFSGIPTGKFAHSIVDAHVYANHSFDLLTQIRRPVRSSPKLALDERIKKLSDLDEIIREATTDELMNLFKLTDYNPHPAMHYKVAV